MLEVNSNERVMADSPRLRRNSPQGYRRVSSAHYADASPLGERLTRIEDRAAELEARIHRRVLFWGRLELRSPPSRLEAGAPLRPQLPPAHGPDRGAPTSRSSQQVLPLRP